MLFAYVLATVCASHKYVAYIEVNLKFVDIFLRLFLICLMKNRFTSSRKNDRGEIKKNDFSIIFQLP